MCWKHCWLHIGEVILQEADNGPLFLLGFRGTKSYSPYEVIHQFRWSKVPQLMISYANNSSSIDSISKKRAV